MAPATAPKPIANIVNGEGSGTGNGMPGLPLCWLADPPSRPISGGMKPGPFDPGAPACEFRGRALFASDAFESDRPVAPNCGTNAKPQDGILKPGMFSGQTSLD